MGLALIFVLCMLTMPTLMAWRDRLGLRLRPFPTAWMGRLAHAVVRHRLLTVVGFLVVTAPLLICASRVRITTDPMAYADPALPSFALRAELAEKAGLVPEPLLIATPNLKAERRVLSNIRDLIGPGRPFSRADCLAERLSRLMAPAPIRRFLGKDERLCMILYPTFNPYEGENPARIMALVDDIRKRCGDDIARISGAPIVFQSMLGLIRRDMVRIGLSSAAVVLAVLVLLMRHPRYFLPAVVPLAGGVVWMLGIMHIAGRQLTAMNVVAMPLVIGLGIDYGVHIVHRLRTGSVEAALSTARRAILAASATTAAAFATLCFARSQALIGMGLAAATGIVSCLIWSLVFLPALLKRPEESKRESPADGGSYGVHESA